MMTSFPAAFSGSVRRAAAFTLLELLVVISIIAVLAGILLPVTGSVMENARKTSAKSTETQIVAAIKSFQTDYGVYPVIPNITQNGSDTTVGGGSTNAGLFNILRATGLGSDAVATTPNTRRVVYFEGKDVKNTTAPKDGFIPSNGTIGPGNQGVSLSVGDLVDPWSNLYFVRYDSGYSDQVMNPYGGGGNDDGGATYDSSKMLRTGVIVWTYGKDGKQGLGGTYTVSSFGDDVVSWQ